MWWILSSALCCAIILTYVYSRKPRSSFPPGPKGWPILGNALEMPNPSDHPHLKYTELKRQYGDIVGLRALGQPIVILNSRKAIVDLLVKRGAIYSSRPPLPSLTKWCNWDWTVGWMPYSEEMHRQRRIINDSFNNSAVKSCEESLSVRAIKWTQSLAKDPHNAKHVNKAMACESIVESVYALDEKKDYISLVEKVFHNVYNTVSPGVHPVDVFPSLSILPPVVFGREFAAHICEFRKNLDIVLNLPYNACRTNWSAGKSRKCLVTDALESQYKEDIKSIKGATGSCYMAGSETTPTLMDSFLINMMLRPEVQKKAQAFIDEVTGGERLPTFSDRNALPYTEAILTEVLRWRAPVPISMPHQLIEEDVYEGHTLPAKTLVIPNGWAVLMDENDYPEPEKFDPERFMDGDEYSNITPDPRQVVFGYGRRICPGRYLGLSLTWISIVTILSVFDISPMYDDEGDAILPDTKYNCGFSLIHAKPYSCRLVPRSQKALDLLNSYKETTEN